MINGPGLLPHSGHKAKSLVVFLHGYGSNGQDLLSIAPLWSKMLPDTEFLAPNGYETWELFPSGYQWFSLKEFTPSYVRTGMETIRPLLMQFLLDALTARDLTPKDLALVGFSQGGIVALDMMFGLKDLSGIICYSGGFFPMPELPLPKPAPEVLLVQGDADTVLPYSYFIQAQEQLTKLGLHPQILTCKGLEHSIDEEGIKVGLAFLMNLFGQKLPA